MKALLALFLALPLIADEPEGTKWYDAEGKLVLVEGPAAEPAETPFVAEWRKREIERRERNRGNWSGEMRPVWNGDYGCRYTYPAYPLRRRFWSGAPVYRTCRGLYRPLPRGGSAVIIRW